MNKEQFEKEVKVTGKDLTTSDFDKKYSYCCLYPVIDFPEINGKNVSVRYLRTEGNFTKNLEEIKDVIKNDFEHHIYYLIPYNVTDSMIISFVDFVFENYPMNRSKEVFISDIYDKINNNDDSKNQMFFNGVKVFPIFIDELVYPVIEKKKALSELWVTYLKPVSYSFTVRNKENRAARSDRYFDSGIVLINIGDFFK